MKSKINYQNEMDILLKKLEDNEEVPKLLLHCCCAPCSSYVLEYLSQYFSITVFFYNPNINTYDEYIHRRDEEIRFISECKFKNDVSFIDADYEKEKFTQQCKGLENEPERGKRCLKCYHLRLLKSAVYAKENGYDYFATTLTLSPLKDADAINSIGKALGEEYGVAYLPSDFKKKNGYKRSIELSKEHDLYRQNYCGCKYSMR